MNKVLLALFSLIALTIITFFAMSSTAAKQPISTESTTESIEEALGDWSGDLEVGVMKITLVLHINQNDAGNLTGTMDCFQQGMKDFPIDNITYKNHTLQFDLKPLMASYEGVMDENHILSGNFVQGGVPVPLAFKKGIFVTEVLKRPQEPKPPYPYNEEEVSYINPLAPEVTLAGTLTMPKSGGPFPAVILITGSGALDRNETLYGHKPFHVIADHLTRHGIAVLRVDDRGVAKSTGNFKTATDADFATDVLAGIEYLKSRPEINSKQIGLLGHSCGALIGPMVAAQSPDVAFLVMLAGPGMNGEQIIYEQGALVARAEGVSEENIAQERLIQEKIFAVIKEEPDMDKANARLREVLSSMLDQSQDTKKTNEYTDMLLTRLSYPWLRHFLVYEPVMALGHVKVPVLVLNGELDLQVPPKQNLPLIEQALKQAGNQDITIVELPKQNHLFQTCQTGAISEYGKIEETMSPSTLDMISDWIVAHTYTTGALDAK